MSNRRSIADFPRNEAGLVDEFIGTAYDTVKNVYDSLEEIQRLDDVLVEIPNLAIDSVDGALAEAMPPIREELDASVTLAQAWAEGTEPVPQAKSAKQWAEQASTTVATGTSSINTIVAEAEQASEAAIVQIDAAVAAAQSAADSAISAGNIFETTASGLAATQPDEYFSVPSVGADGYLTLYQNSGGFAQEIKTYPSTTALTQVLELITAYSSGNSEAVAFTDEQNYLLMRLLVNGTLDMLKAQLVNTTTGDLVFGGDDGFNTIRLGITDSLINGLHLSSTTTPGIIFVDDYGFVVGKITNSGVFLGIQQVTPENIGSNYAALNRQQRTQLIHIIGYGQSLSRGAYSSPPLSTTQPYGNLMIASGTKVRAGEANYNPNSFVPLVEAQLGNDGESPVTALCNGLSRRLIEGGENQEDWTFVGSSPGQGGQSVEALGPGGLGYFEKMVTLIEDHAALAKSLDKTYSVWAYTWDQGEGNYSTTGGGATATKSAYEYAQLYLELFDKLTEEVVRITSQPNRPYLFIYQVGAHRKYGSDTMQLALSQWRTSRQRDDVVMFAPVYIFSTDNPNGDNLHLSNEASWLMGEYRSRAMYETMIVRNGKWRPLEPKSVDWTDSFIDIHFHVPSGHLEFDNTQVGQAVNNGFDIRENGVVVTDRITAVNITSPSTVRLTLNQPAAVNSVLSYARGRLGDPAASGPVLGPRGNLRDTHGLYDKVVSPQGISYDLHNWCVMFEYNRKTGF